MEPFPFNLSGPLPEPLMALHQALTNAVSDTARRQAARQIIDAYCRYYPQQAALQQMEQLHRKAHSIRFAEPGSIIMRQGQLLFYQFNTLLIEAVYVLREQL
jgi:hypothetical protein